MKHYVFVMMSTAVFCASIEAANAVETQKSGWFISPAVGIAAPHEQKIEERQDRLTEYKSKSAPSLSLGVGKHITPHFSGEVAYFHSSPSVQNNSDSGLTVQNTRNQGVMLNGYFKLTPERSISPYVMIGLGVEHETLKRSEAFKETDAKSSSEGTRPKTYSGTAFAYQAGLGVAYQVNPSWNVFAGASIKNKLNVYMGGDDDHGHGMTAMNKGVQIEPIKIGFTYTL